MLLSIPFGSFDLRFLSIFWGTSISVSNLHQLDSSRLPVFPVKEVVLSPPQILIKAALLHGLIMLGATSRGFKVPLFPSYLSVRYLDPFSIGKIRKSIVFPKYMNFLESVPLFPCSPMFPSSQLMFPLFP